MSETLYRKYRPRKFSEVVGQKHVTKTLRNALKNNRIAHAYLLTGSRGTGKTSIARILASAANCEKNKNGEPCLKCKNCKEIANFRSVDIFEIDAASHTGVDNIRELKETINVPPTHGKYKVYIIDEVHMLSQGAFNALLKTIEEPPKHVIFILATTEIHKIPETILSRCQRFDFSKMSFENIIEKLSLIAKSEQVKISKDSLELIAIAAEGGMRDAESLLGQIMSLEDKNITKKEVEEILGVSQQLSIEKVTENIIQKDISSVFTEINNLTKEGCDLEVFSKSFLNYLRKILIIKFDNNPKKSNHVEMTKDQFQKAKDFSEKISLQDLLLLMDNFIEAQGKIKSSFIPQLPLEIAFAKSIRHNKNQNDDHSAAVKKVSLSNQKKVVNEKKITEKKVENKIQEKDSIENSPSKETTNHKKRKENKNIKKVSIEEVLEAWQTVKNEISKQNKSLSSFLSTSRPIRVSDENIVTISTKYDFHKEKISEASNRLTIEEILDKILGSTVKIDMIVDKPSEASTEEYYASLNKDSDETEVSSSINNALNIFGGKIVEQ